MTVLQRLLSRRTASPVSGVKGSLPHRPMSVGSTGLVAGSSLSSCGEHDPVSGACCTEVGWHAVHVDATDPSVIVRWPR